MARKGQSGTQAGAAAADPMVRQRGDHGSGEAMEAMTHGGDGGYICWRCWCCWLLLLLFFVVVVHVVSLTSNIQEHTLDTYDLCQATSGR